MSLYLWSRSLSWSDSAEKYLCKKVRSVLNGRGTDHTAAKYSREGKIGPYCEVVGVLVRMQEPIYNFRGDDQFIECLTAFEFQIANKATIKRQGIVCRYCDLSSTHHESACS